MRHDRLEIDDGPPAAGIVATLRREAAAGRPAFSVRFHDRLVRRIATVASAPVRPAGRGMPSTAWVAAAAILTAWLIGSPHGGGPRPAPVPAGAEHVAAVARDTREPVGIDRLPTFDELESGVQEGAVALAAVLFGMPEWTALAGFDAADLPHRGDER